MNEDRIPFLATPGGKTDMIARAIMAERFTAQKARREYLKSKEPTCINLFGSETRISGLIYNGHEIPAGWRKDSKLNRKYGSSEGVICVPNKKADNFIQLSAELRDLPSLPGAQDFSNRVGFHFMIRAHTVMWCSFERVGDGIVVSVPKWTPANPDYDGDCSHKEQFVPPDCTQLKHSEYYAMKEQAELVKQKPQPEAAQPEDSR